MPQATSRCCTPAVGDCCLTTVRSALTAFNAACRPAAMTGVVTRCFKGSAYCDRVSDTAKETKMNRSQRSLILHRDLTHRLGTTWKQNIGFGASKSVPIQVKHGITFRRAKHSFAWKVSAHPYTAELRSQICMLHPGEAYIDLCNTARHDMSGSCCIT